MVGFGYNVGDKIALLDGTRGKIIDREFYGARSVVETRELIPEINMYWIDVGKGSKLKMHESDIKQKISS